MEKEIGKLQKNDTTDIVLRIDDFADKRGLTIREFVTTERYTGFTKAGVRILAKDWPKFKEMIDSIKDEEMKELVPEEQTTLEEPKEESEPEKPSKDDLPDY